MAVFDYNEQLDADKYKRIERQYRLDAAPSRAEATVDMDAIMRDNNIRYGMPNGHFEDFI